MLSRIKEVVSVTPKGPSDFLPPNILFDVKIRYFGCIEGTIEAHGTDEVDVFNSLRKLVFERVHHFTGGVVTRKGFYAHAKHLGINLGRG